jgi:hypothetical protein
MSTIASPKSDKNRVSFSDNLGVALFNRPMVEEAEQILSLIACAQFRVRSDGLRPSSHHPKV